MSWAESERCRKAHPDAKPPRDSKRKCAHKAAPEDYFYDCEKCGETRFKITSMNLHDSILHKGTTFRSKPYLLCDHNEKQKPENRKEKGVEERFYKCKKCDRTFSNHGTWTIDDHEGHMHFGKSYRSAPMTMDQYLASLKSEEQKKANEPKPKPTRPTVPKYHAFQNRPTDYYQILGVDSRSTIAEIQKAGRNKRIECHPDRLKKPGMSAQDIDWIDSWAKAVGEAADVLSNPATRARYDQKRRSGKRSGA
ncbi:MAG: hypothetical protein Q9222_007036 [Ikaeria aurantiellina]